VRRRTVEGERALSRDGQDHPPVPHVPFRLPKTRTLFSSRAPADGTRFTPACPWRGETMVLELETVMQQLAPFIDGPTSTIIMSEEAYYILYDLVYKFCTRRSCRDAFYVTKSPHVKTSMAELYDEVTLRLGAAADAICQDLQRHRYDPVAFQSAVSEIWREWERRTHCVSAVVRYVDRFYVRRFGLPNVTEASFMKLARALAPTFVHHSFASTWFATGRSSDYINVRELFWLPTGGPDFMAARELFLRKLELECERRKRMLRAWQRIRRCVRIAGQFARLLLDMYDYRPNGRGAKRARLSFEAAAEKVGSANGGM
jgi:hypothetical protein